MSATGSAATYIGRMGGLAVALGVGAALASGAGAAWADSSDSSSKSSQSSSDSSDDSGKKAPSSKAESKAEKAEKADKAEEDSTATEESKSEAKKADKSSSTKRTTRAESAKTESEEPKSEQPEAKATSGPEREVTDTSVADESPTTVTVDTTPAPAAQATTSAADTNTAPTKTAPTLNVTAADKKAFTAITKAARTAEAKASQTDPAAPANAPALEALLGWVRREAERIATPGDPTAAGAAYAAAAVVEPLPSRLDSNQVGWVTGPGITNLPGGFNIYGTDLGIMWDGGTIDGQRFVHVAFGDTFSQPNMIPNPGWRNNVLLLSFDDRLDNGLTLAPTGPAFQFIDRSTGQVGPFGGEVTVIPTAGIHINGTQYVNYMSVRSWDTPGRWTTNYSAISQFYPGSGGGDWRIVPSTIRSSGWLRSSTPYRPGDQNFQQMAYVLQPEDQAAEGNPRYLYAFGTPSGRAGSAYLSRVAEDSVTDLARYEYWDGDRWVAGNAAVAKPVIGSDTSSGLFGFVVDWANDPNNFGGYLGGLFGPKTGGNVSELSVQYNEYLDKYVLLYGDGNNNVQMRVADTPESVWSDPVQLASSAQHPGLYAPFIHPWSGTGLIVDGNGDADYENLYWNMSLWGPYNVVLMETDLSPIHTIQV